MPHTPSFTLPAVRAEVSSLWKLAWPILIGQLATVGMGAADVAMTGHTNPEELAAVSLGAAIWSIVLVTVSGIMMSVNTLVAHEIGAARHDRVPHIVRQSLWKALLIGLVACVLTNIAALVFDHLMLEPAVAAKAKLFVHIISAALPAFTTYRALYGYSTSINQTKPVMVIALAALALNIFINYLLIYGHWGMPRLGGIGCAVATTCCVWMMLAAMVLWIRRAPAYRATFPFGQWEAPQWASIAPMLRLGLPIGVTYFAEVSAFGVISLLVARFGVVQVSAHQIALNFSSVVFMVPLTFGIALVTRVGHAVGEADLHRARFISWVGVAMSLAAAVASAIFITLFRHQIAAGYTSDPQVQALCAQLLLFAALFQLSDATQVATSSAIRGYKVTRQPMLIQLLAFWGFSLPIGYVLGLAPQGFAWSPPAPMGAAGFWIGLVTGLTVAAVLLTWYLNRLSLRRLHG
ncbi:MATE family efflux transporter [Janthinobacterium aquaticum]|uniref:MATE family efflux transporter n=1 Tax=Janthinobacterium sp. FT58W TaxID=2654254 RepID=UPI00126580E0|nr:MATE family efflux transporter [Janthinobacterium sp. FT58W]KAB8041329.1 MATE family efflux transporter [Janthinobacterium sp. FT58W]